MALRRGFILEYRLVSCLCGSLPQKAYFRGKRIDCRKYNPVFDARILF
jgi:hypothetical protein